MFWLGAIVDTLNCEAGFDQSAKDVAQVVAEFDAAILSMIHFLGVGSGYTIGRAIPLDRAHRGLLEAR